MGELTVKGMRIGSGVPKTIVSILAADREGALQQARQALDAGADLLEYRADFAADASDVSGIVAMARAVAGASPANPVVFTMRTKSQGGCADWSKSNVVELCEAVIADRAVDVIDIESWLGDEAVSSLCRAAHDAGMTSLVSFHDFEKTPFPEEMEQLLLHFFDLGADIAKIAVMARDACDAASLLGVTARVSALDTTGPLVAISMGAEGSITRLTGEIFGSAMTFCSLSRSSAPGQLDISQAKAIMSQLHDVVAT